MAARAAVAVARDEIRGSLVISDNDAQAPAAATLRDKGRPMSLPRYASRGPGVFLLHYAARRLVSHLIVLAAVLSAVGCAIGSQYAVKNLVDVLGSGQPSDLALWSAVGLLLALVAGDNLLWRLAGWVATYAFVAVGGDLRLDLFDYLSGHGSRYFSDQFPGAVAGRITTAANAAWSIENQLTWTTIPPAVAVISSIVVLSVINWQITAVLFVIVTILGAVIARRAAQGHHLHARFASRAATVTGDLADIGVFHAFSVFVVTAGVLVWAVTLWRAGQITTGDVVLTTSLGFTVLHASRDLAMALVEVVQHFAKLGEAITVLGLPHEIEDAPDAEPLIHLGGSISFENVDFSYPNGERVLEDFNLDIPAGQKIGLVGRTGAGKSTILALLQRLYEPRAGRVLIDEQDIAEVTQQSLRQSIAVVQQDISLFHRSVLENLRYGKPEATEEEVRRAAEMARCTEFICRMPQGFDTVVGERGLKLSGGERQRLAIARAFLRDAPIILLDEATSALDTDSEQAIQEALMRLVKGRTVIAIAHRLSTLASFDRIVVLEGGRIVEDGPSADFLRRKGIRGATTGRELAIERPS